METEQKAAISEKGVEDDDGGEEDAVEEEGRCRRLRRGRTRWSRGAAWEEDDGCSVGGGRGMHSGRSMRCTGKNSFLRIIIFFYNIFVVLLY